MAKGRWVSGTSRPKATKVAVPEAVKTRVTTKAHELIETVLKPQYVKPPPEEPRFNYIVDIRGKWYRRYYYFYAIYCSPGPNAIAPSFEAKFARLEYVGTNSFHLSFMRYTGEWVVLSTNLTLDECFESIRNDHWFVL